MKQLVILIAYINVGNMSILKSRERLIPIRGELEKMFSSDVQDETGTIIKHIVIPVNNQSTSIECIFPIVEDLPEEIIEKLEKIELTQKEYESDRSKD